MNSNFRNSKGTTREEWNNWPTVEFDDLTTSFAMLQYIQQLIRKESNNMEQILTPIIEEEFEWQFEMIVTISLRYV
ncbi:hypothetical protein A3Q56_06375 [Intoshia linei]|uniref:Uncharacterized protein n=1 Tax=Intoshia linei TaxID=1819745 RepID=A0A177AV57_9BILA|nr:hypothetical protein A3Q56_06375 [Intoshia linei]